MEDVEKAALSQLDSAMGACARALEAERRFIKSDAVMPEFWRLVAPILVIAAETLAAEYSELATACHQRVAEVKAWEAAVKIFAQAAIREPKLPKAQPATQLFDTLLRMIANDHSEVHALCAKGFAATVGQSCVNEHSNALVKHQQEVRGASDAELDAGNAIGVCVVRASPG